MKYLPILFSLALFISSCDSQNTSSDNSSSVANNESGISFDIDESSWFSRDKGYVVSYLEKNRGDKVALKEEQLVAYYTTDEESDISYPNLMLTDNILPGAPPSMDDLEQRLNAMSTDFAANANLLNNLAIEQPILFRDRQMVLMELPGTQEPAGQMKMRQAVFFRGNRVVGIQLSYIEGRDEKYFGDFNKIIETINF